MTALIQILSGRAPDPALSDDQWRALLAIADRTRSTTLLSGSPHVPAWFAEQVAARVASNGVHRRRLLGACQEAAGVLSRTGVDFIVLKGFTHESGFGIDPGLRAQTDLDLLLHPQDISAARAALIAAGYTPHPGAALSEDHLPPLLKPATWTWSGDYYDPSFPAVIELHHALWSTSRDGIPVPGTDEFWRRRVMLEVAGVRLPALEETDRLAFASLHLLRHILRNDARPAHAYEVASALRFRASDDAFWTRWQGLHPAPLRRLQTVAFQFAARWFGHGLPPAPREEWRAMPGRIQEWFRRYEWSPIGNLTEPDNKDVLWLHLALLPGFADRLAVARRRLFPLHIPRPGERRRRARYHLLALARAVATAMSR